VLTNLETLRVWPSRHCKIAGYRRGHTLAPSIITSLLQLISTCAVDRKDQLTPCAQHICPTTVCSSCVFALRFSSTWQCYYVAKLLPGSCDLVSLLICVSVRASVRLSVRWLVGPLACWFVGLSLCCHVGALIRRIVALLVCLVQVCRVGGVAVALPCVARLFLALRKRACTCPDFLKCLRMTFYIMHI